MFLERSLVHMQLNGLNSIAVIETCVIIITKGVWIGQTIITNFVGFPTVDAHRVEDFDHPFEFRVEPIEVADDCHRRVLEMLVNCSCDQVVHDVAVC
jgi:hypothetical protein